MSFLEIYMIGIIIVLAIWVIYSTYNYSKEKTFDDIRADIYKLFLKAEENFASGEGIQKMDWVITKVHDLLPNWLQFFLSEDTLRKTVQYIFDQVEDLLDDGKINKSTKEENIETDENNNEEVGD